VPGENRQIKEMNLGRCLLVFIPLGIGMYLITCRLPPVISFALGMLLIVFLGIQVRLGRLPWLEAKEGKKDRFIVWLESKLPFLRAGFYKR
jgi:hypothetical protein